MQVTLSNLEKNHNVIIQGLTRFEESNMSQVYKSIPIKSSEITPYAQYLSRCYFLKLDAANLATLPRINSEDSTIPIFPGKRLNWETPITTSDRTTGIQNTLKVSLVPRLK